MSESSGSFANFAITVRQPAALRSVPDSSAA
jgi:hypothetical protein